MENMKAAKEKTKGLVPYSLGFLSNSLSYVVISNLNYALTQSVGLTAITVGSIFLFSRIFDGVTDIIASFIVDHTHTKWGKARPYDLMLLPLWLLVIMCFSVPGNFSTFGKVLWVVLTYNMCQSVCYTFTQVAEATRLKRSFPESTRSKVVAASAAIGTLGGIVIGAMMPVLISIFENQPHGWTIISSIVSIPCMIAGLCRFLFLREMDEDTPEERKQSVPFKTAVKVLFKNKYVFMLGAALLMLAMNNSVTSPATTYYFKFIYGDVAAAAIPSLIGSFSLILIVFMPKLMEKFGSRNIMVAAFAALVLGNVAKYLMPVNIIWLTVCSILASLGVLYMSSMKNIALIECMNYGKEQSGVEMEAVYSSVSGVADKLGLGIGSFLLGLILQLGGYDGNLLVQPQSALTSVQFCYAALPAILGVIGMIAIWFYAPTKQRKKA